jgi:prophage antirepressor-like protein
MTNISVFEFESNQLEIVMINDHPWFNASQVAKALGYANPSKALQDNVSAKYNQQLDLGRRGKKPIFISEPGLYQLVMRSSLPNAEKFQDWVFEEVLPAIRKTGQYAIAHQVPKTYSQALLEAARLAEENERLEAQNILLEQQNEQLSEAVDELFNYSSIVRVAKFNGISETQFKWHKLKAVSTQMGLEIKKVPCPRFVEKNLYSHDAWRVAYPGIPLPETTTLVIQSVK